MSWSRSFLRLAGRRAVGAYLDRLDDGWPLAARQPCIVRLRDERVTGQVIDGIDDAIVLRRLGSHEIVPFGVALDLFERLAGVTGEDLMVPLDEELGLLDLDEHVRGIAPEPARALMDHDPAVRQRVALAR